MIEILKTVTPSPEQWEIIIEGMRNPMNSWNNSDSYKTVIEDPETLNTADFEFFLGEKDHERMMSLSNGGSVHAKYRRMIPVWVTINAPLYWWKEFDTYKVGTVTNSCSTMHKLSDKEFTLKDFSHEHLIDPEGYSDDHNKVEKIPIDRFRRIDSPRSLLCSVIKILNECRKLYLETEDKAYWRQMIQLLPSSYNQKRTVFLNYETLSNIYKWRKDHKLDEWVELCKWIETLPYSEIITGEKKDG